MVDHNRTHRVPSSVRPPSRENDGMDVHTEAILDGLQRVDAIAALVESVLIWRAAHIAWNTGLYPSEQLLVRLIYKEGCKNPQAMDLLARIYFQQGRYDRAKSLWEDAVAFQPGNPLLKRALARCELVLKSPKKELFAFRLKQVVRMTTILTACLLLFWGAYASKDALSDWMRGPDTASRLAGRFHYDYETQANDFMAGSEHLFSRGAYLQSADLPTSDSYVESSFAESDAQDLGADLLDKERLTFTRKKAINGATLGRIEVYVERVGNVVKASGKVPNLHTRYLVEGALFSMPGVEQVDLRGLQVDRSYSVRKGDSLWIISRRLFGSGDNWSLLARYNNLDNPSQLRIGQKLTLPLGNEVLVPNR